MAAVDLLSTKRATTHDMNRYSAILLARWQKGPTGSFFQYRADTSRLLEKWRIEKSQVVGAFGSSRTVKYSIGCFQVPYRVCK